MSDFFKRLTLKEDPSIYEDKDSHLVRVLTVKDFLALGVGTIVSTSIFTLPGVVALNILVHQWYSHLCCCYRRGFGSFCLC
jgi:hypothetical protein